MKINCFFVGNDRISYLKSWIITVISGLDVEIDNSGKSSATEISAIITKDSGVRNI